MWDDAESRIKSELEPKEQLLWYGQPRRGMVLRPSDAFLIPFSLLWGGFAIFWEYMAFAEGTPLFFRLWGIPFVCVGLYLIFGRFLFDAYQRKNTYYALSNERVLILSKTFQTNKRSLAVESMGEISMTESADKSGTITFGQPLPWYIASGFPQPGISKPWTFEMINDVRSVFDKIRHAQRDAKRVAMSV